MKDRKRDQTPKRDEKTEKMRAKAGKLERTDTEKGDNAFLEAGADRRGGAGSSDQEGQSWGAVLQSPAGGLPGWSVLGASGRHCGLRVFLHSSSTLVGKLFHVSGT